MPLNAFIIRPFGRKDVVSGMPAAHPDPGELAPAGNGAGRVRPEQVTVTTIDFDAVQRELIGPALDQLRIVPYTTSEILTAGNIREDMFRLLLTADLVIADVSTHNANVFYELGIRQAFRNKYTFLLRCDLSDYPFDLRTDRYFEYNWRDPAKSVTGLVAALRATISSDKADSPVFALLPNLAAEDRARFINVPPDFREEVERARKYHRPGDLRLLATEVEGHLWEVEGLREIGRAQFELNYIHGAKFTWELIAGRYPDDVEANTALSTIYQRLNDSPRSEQALARVSRSSTLSGTRLAQVRALQGRNLKARWVDDWKLDASDGAAPLPVPEKILAERQERALCSPLLQRAYDAYAEAFKADLNHTYAGLNAVGLLIVQTELAERLPRVWASLQRRPEDAAGELETRKARIKALTASLELSLEAERDALRRSERVDFWFEILRAAVECLISVQPERVAQMYRDAMLWAPGDAERSMRQQLEVYRDLDVGEAARGWNVGIGTLKENIDRALSVIRTEAARKPSGRADRILLFTGLRLDPVDWTRERERSAGQEGACPPEADPAAAGRSSGRFPHERVDAARAAIGQVVEEEQEQARKLGGRILFGIAGGAAGGDILFHQVCEDLAIETQIYLALPREQYIGAYVAPAGYTWVEQFNALYRRHRSNGVGAPDPARPAAVNILADSPELPRWLQCKPYYNVGRRTNLWMLEHALVQSVVNDNAEITLIVLWDDETRHGMGGFGSLMRLADQNGIKVRRIDRDQWLA